MAPIYDLVPHTAEIRHVAIPIERRGFLLTLYHKSFDVVGDFGERPEIEWSMEKMTDLLPCPFCGEDEDLHFETARYHPENIRIACYGCGCNLEFSLSEAQAINTWNTRFPVTTGPESKQVFLPGQAYYDEGKACQQATKPAQLMN